MHPFEQNKRYYDLAVKWKNGLITPEEEQEFADWYLKEQGDPVFLQVDFVQNESAHEQRMLDGLQRKVRSVPTKKWTLQWLPYAAAVFLFAITLGGGWFFLNTHQQKINVSESKLLDHLLLSEIRSGTQHAFITTSDGQRVELDSTHFGVVVGTEDIHYENGRSLGLDLSEQLTLTTPKGSTYKVTLSDGSRVWLNADSKLIYPRKFDSDKRVVELIGEAYFEVEKIDDSNRNNKSGSVPFQVISKGQVVEVLGTEFNVNAYSDQKYIKTTLVSGRVQVQAQASSSSNSNILKNHSVLLEPMEQSVFTENSSESGFNLIKRDVNVNTELAWRSGRFNFEGKNFEQIMIEIGRWYDLEIVYEQGIPKESFFGNAFKTDNLSVILELLESSHIQYRVTSDRKLVISNK